MRKTFFWILFGTAVIGIAFFSFFRMDATPLISAPSNPSAKRLSPPPIDAAIIERQLNYTPTPENLAEEARFDREQAEHAGLWLQDADSKRRVTGAEQLSAYPTPEAEKMLAQSLRADLSPEVRAAAAQSLDYFDKLQENSLQTLLTALEDPDEDVRLNALSTLENQHRKLESGSARAKKIFSGLKKMEKSPRVNMETQQAIQDFLRDQE